MTFGNPHDDHPNAERFTRMSMKVRHMARIALALTSALSISSIAFAQTKCEVPAVGGGTGKIVGKVTERGKDPIGCANIVLLGANRRALTDDDGTLVNPCVPDGPLPVRVQEVGHGKLDQQVTVNAGQTVTVDFNFGEAKTVKTLEEIEVRAEKRIDTKSSTTKQTITAEKLKELPVDNLREAVATKAGVV